MRSDQLREKSQEGFSVTRRIQFGYAQLRIREPRNVAHIFGTQLIQLGKGPIVNGEPRSRGGLTTTCSVGVVWETHCTLSQTLVTVWAELLLAKQTTENNRKVTQFCQCADQVV